MISERISLEVLDKAHRKLSRHIAALIVSAMAERDADFSDIAKRLDVSEITVRRWFKRLLDGQGSDLGQVASIFVALDFHLQFRLQPVETETGVNVEVEEAA